MSLAPLMLIYMITNTIPYLNNWLLCFVFFCLLVFNVFSLLANKSFYIVSPCCCPFVTSRISAPSLFSMCREQISRGMRKYFMRKIYLHVPTSSQIVTISNPCVIKLLRNNYTNLVNINVKSTHFPYLKTQNNPRQGDMPLKSFSFFQNSLFKNAM